VELFSKQQGIQLIAVSRLHLFFTTGFRSVEVVITLNRIYVMTNSRIEDILEEKEAQDIVDGYIRATVAY
jgi:hypothetical protein